MCEYKVVVFGAGAVGKSAMTLQFVKGYFITDYDPTIEDCYKRTISVDQEMVQLDILDTAGQDDFAGMRVFYMRQGKAFILVYSIDDRASFEEIEVFYQDLLRTRGGPDHIPLVLCGNKCDLTDQRVISKAEGQELADRMNAVFLETSAKYNLNIDNAFEALVRGVRKYYGPITPVQQLQPSSRKKIRRRKCQLL